MENVLTAIGTAVVTLLGVWRMFAHYETRNDAAHTELGRRIDNLGARLDARLDGATAALNTRIDKLYESSRRVKRNRRRAVRLAGRPLPYPLTRPPRVVDR